MSLSHHVLKITLVIIFASSGLLRAEESSFWQKHVIDDSQNGADGVKAKDIDGDGDLDLIAGWEESGQVAIYTNPGDQKTIRKSWQKVTVAQPGDIEGVAFGDFDNDGSEDAVSFSEGQAKKVSLHFAPANIGQYQQEELWTSVSTPAPALKWMDGKAFDVNQDGWLDIIVAAKSSKSVKAALTEIDWLDIIVAAKSSVSAKAAQAEIDWLDIIVAAKSSISARATQTEIGWLESPGVTSSRVRNGASWTYHKIGNVGWTMSLELVDIDVDGDLDLFITDRTGPHKGARWLVNPGPGKALSKKWRDKRISHITTAMFSDIGSFFGEDLGILVASRHSNELNFYYKEYDYWASKKIIWNNKANDIGGDLKAAKVFDVDQDGLDDIVITTTEKLAKTIMGVSNSHVYWLKNPGSFQKRWDVLPIAVRHGQKFDDIVLIDIDQDGDKDILTTEERARLGVIWYENPYY